MAASPALSVAMKFLAEPSISSLAGVACPTSNAIRSLEASLNVRGMYVVGPISSVTSCSAMNAAYWWVGDAVQRESEWGHYRALLFLLR